MRTHVPHRLAGALTVVVATGALLAGCSGSGSPASGAPAPSQAPAADYGDYYGGGAEAAPAPADSADRAAGQATAADRQVVQTGRMTLTTEDPVAIVDDVVTLVRGQGADARVESRDETSADGARGSSATLTVRVPADRMDATVDGLKQLGDVSSLTISEEDVTAAAQDLDARIAAQQISVDRMSTVLAGAQTTADIISVEAALTQRQSDLEAMTAERSRIADQVSLSTLTIWITTPSQVATSDDDGPTSFGDAVARGWRSLTGAARSVAFAFGVALPWLALVGIVVAAVVLPVRRRRRRSALVPAMTGPAPAPAVEPVLVPASVPAGAPSEAASPKVGPATAGEPTG